MYFEKQTVKQPRTRPVFVWALFVALIPLTVYNITKVITVISSDSREVHTQEVPAQASSSERLRDPVLISQPTQTALDVISTAATPNERELEIRDLVEELIKTEVHDWSTIEPVFENGHLVRIRIYRDGHAWLGKVLIMHPDDVGNEDRRMQEKIILSSSLCSSKTFPFFDQGKISKIFMVTYICEKEKVT